MAVSSLSLLADLDPPAQTVPGEGSPVKKIDSDGLRNLGRNLTSLFDQYRSDRRLAELRWLRNQRQYLGVYDPDIEDLLAKGRSRAYPKLTRIKCISVLSRLMNLMFPGNERNWELKASPWPDMSPQDVKDAVAACLQKDQEAGSPPPKLTREYVKGAIQSYCDERAKTLSDLIDDQLQEIGGDQTADYISLNRKVVRSGIQYGMGVLCGPYARRAKTVTWDVTPDGQLISQSTDSFKPQFDFVTVWDVYPDMSAKTLADMDGYFRRHVMSRGQLRALADREDFLGDQVLAYLKQSPVGNYRPQPYESELRSMGVKVNVNEQKTETKKYEVLAWKGKTSGEYLRMAGVDVDDDKLSDDLDAEIWTIDGYVIKAALNPWAELGVDVKTLHYFLFDEDDTSPIGFGLPNALRDSQMALSASTRMLLDNASVVCGPNLELNTNLLRPDQDLTSTSAYKIWYRREDEEPDTAQWPAVRNVEINGHLNELQQIIEMFLKFADAETFVGPATGGDMSKAPSEPMRTAAGASMLRGDAALPFKDIVRAFDQFTMSVIESLVQFNRKFNPDLAPEADYNVIARGATSLIAKEVRGMQADQMVSSLQPEERIRVDWEKLTDARFKARDMEGMLVSEDEARRREAAQSQQQQKQADQQQQMVEAQIRKLLSDAYKNIAQGQKNTANADVASIKGALDLLEKGLSGGGGIGQATAGDGGGQIPAIAQGNPGSAADGGTPGLPPGYA